MSATDSRECLFVSESEESDHDNKSLGRAGELYI